MKDDILFTDGEEKFEGEFDGDNGHEKSPLQSEDY